MEDRRFIEETFPVREISEESAKEKSIRHGHISTFHIWWARRPLASSRATNFAALIPEPKNQEEAKKIRDFIVKLSKWDNSLDETLFEEARRMIRNANEGKPPKVLDPFSGGGAIPLEALRLGCETYASDYNPVATLILKCTLEYPQKYAANNRLQHGLMSDKRDNRLLNDVNKWANWVLQEAKKEILSYYPEEKDGSIPVGYIWARTITCQNPSCGAVIPLIRQFWLVNKKDKKVSFYPYVSGKQVLFRIVGTGYEKTPRGFDPEKGTISGAIATCLICGSVTVGKSIQKLSASGKSGQRMLVVISHKEGLSGKKYRVANEEDVRIFEKASSYLVGKRRSLFSEWGIDPIPDEPIHTPDNKEYQPGNLLYNFTPVMLYGMIKWGDVFNARQKLALITFVEKVRQARQNILKENADEEYSKVVLSYLSIILDRLADKNASLVVYNVYGEKVEHVFGRQALSVVWDYVEVNPFTDVGWPNMQEWVERIITHCSYLPASAIVTQSSALSLSFPDNFFDAVFTDPPYYDNVPYADLSDFFYVWLKRTIGDQYPDLFSTPLTPKSQEVIAELPLLRGMNKNEASLLVSGVKTSQNFENMLGQSLKEIHRVLRPNGICVLVYAHKSTAGWETLVNSILDSGLVVTGAWPIHTEMKARLRARESAALASSIYMISRKFAKKDIGFYNEVMQELRIFLTKKLDKIWAEGISGADFFISAIGSAIEVFGKYEKVIDDEGNVMRGDRLLEQVRRIVTDYAVKQVLHNGFAAEIKPMTRLYVLWRWAYGDVRIDFDDANKLGQSVGIDISQEWNRAFIKKDKEFIEILGPDDRDISQLENSSELIDILHHVLLLWKKGKSEEVMQVLSESGYGKSDVFYRVAQAISESLTNGSKEKKLLDGFLAGKERITKNLRKGSEQTRLDE
jgi:putative DNA methylase